MIRRVSRHVLMGSVSLVVGLGLMGYEISLAARRAQRTDAAIWRQVDAALARRRPADRPLTRSTHKPLATRHVLLVEAVIQVESNGDPLTVGRHGERGLMQIKGDTWADVTERLYGRRLGFDQAFDPATNRKVGTAYLAELREFLSRHRADWRADERSLLLACYNAGPGRVQASGFDLDGLPLSTRDYVERASALHDALAEEQYDRALQLVAVPATMPES